MTASVFTPQQSSSPAPVAPAPQPGAEWRANPARRGPVVLATDATGTSDAALTAAWLLAERLGVALHVVTVLEPLPIYAGGAEMMMPLTYDVERRAAREAMVRHRVEAVVGPGIPWEFTVRYGSVAREIAAVARDRAASIVVVGAAPRQRFGRTVAGARAAQLLREAACPVLSVEPTFDRLPFQAVVAIDFSPASVRAAQAALLVLAEGGVLTLVHVLPPFALDRPQRLSHGGAFDPGFGGMFSRLREELRPYVPAGVSVETRNLEGAVVERVLHCADALGAELIAVGTHGPGLVERFFVGSVATGVLHGAARTVLACPAPPPAEALALTLRLTGSAASVEVDDWPAVLDAFTRRNAGRPVTIEVDDPEVGAQVQAQGYRLLGATYDRHDRRVELMLGDGANDAVRHLTRSIGDVQSVALCAGEAGRDHALELRHGRGHTLLLLGDWSHGMPTDDAPAAAREP